MRRATGSYSRRWQSQMPLDLFFLASEVHLGSPSRVRRRHARSPKTSRSRTSTRATSTPTRCARRVVAAGVSARRRGSGPARSRSTTARRSAALLPRVGLTQKEGEEVGDVEQAHGAPRRRYGYPILLRNRGGEPKPSSLTTRRNLTRSSRARRARSLVERFLEDLVESAVARPLRRRRSARAVAIVEVLEEAGDIQYRPRGGPAAVQHQRQHARHARARARRRSSRRWASRGS